MPRWPPRAAVPNRLRWAALLALSLAGLSACGTGSAAGIRQWSLTLPTAQNLQLAGGEVAVTSGSTLLVSPLTSWRPHRVALSHGETCSLTGDLNPALVCLVPGQGGTTVLVQPTVGQGLSIADLVAPVQAMTVVADTGFVVVQITLTQGSQQTIALDLANQAVVTLNLPPGRAIGLSGATYLAEASSVGGNQALVGVNLPSGTSHTLAVLPAPLLDPMLGQGWVFGFPLTSQSSPPRFDAYSASGGQLAHLPLPNGLLSGVPYAVGPGYALLVMNGGYQVFLAQGQTSISLALPALAGDLVGSNRQDVAYVLQGHRLHLIAVPPQVP